MKTVLMAVIGLMLVASGVRADQPGLSNKPLSVFIDESGGPATINGQLVGSGLHATGYPTYEVPQLDPNNPDTFVVSGDVVLTEPGNPGVISDVLRFIETSSIQFDSADTDPTIPDLLNINNQAPLDFGLDFPAFAAEGVGEGLDISNNRFLQANQIWIEESCTGVTTYKVGCSTYTIVSDEEGQPGAPVTPEPCSMALLALGGVPLALLRRRK